MHLYKLLCVKLDDIKSIHLDEDIFGATRRITITYKDDSKETFPGANDKFINLYFDLQDENAHKLRRLINSSKERIEYIEILERSGNFEPSLISVKVGSRDLIVSYKNKPIIDRILNPNSDLDRYVIDTIINRYNLTRDDIIKRLKNDTVLKEEIESLSNLYGRVNEPFNTLFYNIKNSNKLSDRKTEPIYKNHVYSKVEYDIIDAIGFENNQPNRMTVTYKSGDTVMACGIDACREFLKEARLRGITKVNSYPKESEKIEKNISDYIAKEEEKSLIKRLLKRVKKG